MKAIHWIGLGLIVAALWIGASASLPDNEDPVWTSPSLGDVETRLEGLSFDEFTEWAYRLYILRFPETVTRMGMADAWDVRHNRLNDVSPEYVQETHAIESEILARLLAFDREALNDVQRITYDVFAWYWTDRVALQPFSDHGYPVSFFFVTSRDQLLYDLLTEAHPIETLENAQDYVARLQQVGRQFDQVIEGLERRAQAGIILPRDMIDWTLGGLRAMTYGPARSSDYYTTFRDRLARIEGLESSTKQELLSSAEDAIEQTVLPAYRSLYDTMVDLRAEAPADIGFSRVPEGEAFYDAILRHYTGTDLTAQEIHDLGLREVERLRGEIRTAADALGYDGSGSMASIFSFAADRGGDLRGSEILSEYTRLVDASKTASLAVFETLPATDVVVIEHPIGGFYQAAPRDGSRPAVFGASTQGGQDRYTMPTLTYHETIPGHHLQIAGAQELPLSLLQNEETFLGFTEGWALYAERLAWELGWYEDDAYGNLGRLQFEMMRAARLVVDTGIHALGWGNARAVEVYREATGKDARSAQFDIYRYAVWPGQATSYMVGMLSILELREAVQAAQGDDFDLKDFHAAVLSQGGIPLEILETILSDRIAESTASP